MVGEVLTAAIVVLLVLVTVGVQRALPRHQVAVPVVVAAVVAAAWWLLDPFREFMSSHTSGLLIGVVLGFVIVFAEKRRVKQA